MAPRNKVAKLPANVKAWLDKALVEENFGNYALLEEELAKRGHYISRGSLQRYGKGFSDRLSALAVAAEQAQAVVAAAPDEEGAINEALMRLVQEQIFNLLIKDGEKDLPKIARAVAELGKASVVQKKWQAEVRAKLESAAQKVEAIAKKGGLNSDTINTIRREILGVAER